MINTPGCLSKFAHKLGNKRTYILHAYSLLKFLICKNLYISMVSDIVQNTMNQLENKVEQDVATLFIMN